ncbi:hypothetical protein D3C80_1783430 [compost metagenome]
MHHLLELASLGLGDGMAEMMQLDLDRLLADEFEWFEQIIQGPHQQYGSEQKSDQEPTRQLAHPFPQLVISLTGVTHHLQLAKL